MADLGKGLMESHDSNRPSSGVYVDRGDVSFYEDLLRQCKDSLKTPFMTRRVPLQKEDPTEELIDIHIDIQNLERQFKECVEIGTFLLKKNREVEAECANMQQKLSTYITQGVNANQQEITIQEKFTQQEWMLKEEKEKRKRLKETLRQATMELETV